ncbi:MAG: hypothetical protein ACRC8B_22880 [Aeromonas sobria]|uniref:hypothetical protein n=1 Tax=Aeromonas sobria TaxID=646 RepID=UPI003F39DDEC
MTNQIHTVAVKALNTMKAAGIAQDGRTRLGSFKVAKEVTQRWAKGVRRDVFAEFGGSDNKGRGHFLSIIGCADSLTFKGWADLTHWLAAVEVELVAMISKHSPMTYVKHRASGRVRRFAVGSCDAVNTQTKPVPGSDWGVSAMTVGQAMADIDNGSAFLCNERGEEITKPVSTSTPTEWAHFQCLPSSGRALNVRRINVECEATDKTQILIDGQWEESGVTLQELRHMVAFGEAEWVEAPKLKMTKPAPAESPIKAEARKLLNLMEKRGFGPDMQITQMWDDIDDICGLARSLRLQLISEAGHTGNGLTNKEHLQIRTLIDVVPTRRCFLDTLKMGWKKLHHELSKIVLA